MKCGLCLVAASAAAFAFSSPANADTIVPGDSSVRYATNVDNTFTVSSGGLSLYGTTGYADSSSLSGVNPIFGLDAGSYVAGGGYADAGIVLYFDGSLTLGALQGVDITTAADPSGFWASVTPTVNLWLDSDNSNSFFAFSGETLTGLAGDSYFGASSTGDVNASTTFSHLGGLGSGSYTLAQLQSGAVAGIDADTKVALWIGINNSNVPAGGSYNYASISQVDVAAVPLPVAALGGLALFGGIGGIGGLKRLRRRQPIA